MDNSIPNADVPEQLTVLQVDITSWSQFLSIVPALHYGGWLFRGHGSEKWKLWSGLDRERDERERNRKTWDRTFRALKTNNQFVWIDGTSFLSSSLTLPTKHVEERSAIETYIRYSAQAFDPKYRSIQALSEMQHYGSKTRLLDFTESVFVALFFAFEARTSPDKRALYAINRERLFSACAPILPKSSGEQMTDEGYELEVNPSAFQEMSALLAVEKNIDRTDESPRGILPVFLRGSNKRLTAQNGCFLLPLSFETFDQNLAEAFSTTAEELANPSHRVSGVRRVNACSFSDVAIIKFVFNQQMEDGAWEILDHANISSRTMYPDRVGLARSIRYDN